MTNEEDNPSLWHARRVYFWVPELFYPRRVKHIPCPECGNVDGLVKMSGWNRRVNELFFNHLSYEYEHISLGSTSSVCTWTRVLCLM